jgi:flagellar hook-basal body complex protein FliE
MIPAIPSIPSIGAAESVGTTQAAGATQAAGSTAGSAGAASSTSSSDSFENMLGQAIDSLNGATNNATNVSLEAAAGNASVADATIASTEADLDTQLASALTDKAVTSLNTIMDMQA